MRSNGRALNLRRSAAMPQYAALDVSNEETSIHIIDKAGVTVWRGKRASDPDMLTTALRRYAPDLVRVGLETEPLAPWLYHTCKALGLPIVCLDARPPSDRGSCRNRANQSRLRSDARSKIRRGWTNVGAGRALNSRSDRDPARLFLPALLRAADQRGRLKKVALVPEMRKLLVTLNAIVRDHTPCSQSLLDLQHSRSEPVR